MKSIQRRTWQQDFRKDFRDKWEAGQRNYTCVATPASGKTLATADVGGDVLKEHVVERLVIAVPSKTLKTQWAKALHEEGISINPKWEGDAPENADDFQGVAVTYHSLVTQKEIHRVLCARRRTLVVFDEIHHLGKERAWGDAALQAFEPARLRLGLSGTPFRSDEGFIPFVRYDDAGVAVADYGYSYSRALSDQVCREVSFPNYGGEARWLGRYGEQQAAIHEPLREGLDSERVRAFLDPDLDAMRVMCEKAHQQLTDVRQSGHRDAGGLLIASDIREAERFHRLLTRVTGEKPMLVVSDHEDATTVDAYKGSAHRWLVAVKMVSEGVDIDRLRVLVYATNTMTELYFRQAVGRVLRMIKGIEAQLAYVFIPQHPTLAKWATKMLAEVDEHRARQKKPDPPPRPPGPDKPTYIFQPLETKAFESGATFNGESFTVAEMAVAHQVKARIRTHSNLQDEQVAYILRTAQQFQESPPEADTSASGTDRPVWEELEALRRQCAKLASRRDILLGLEPGETHKEWIRRGGMPAAQADRADQRRKYEWLISDLKDYRGSDYSDR